MHIRCIREIVYFSGPTLEIFCFTLPDPVSQVWVGRSEYYFFIFSGFIFVFSCSNIAKT